MLQERRSWLYLLIGASMIFTTIVILRGFRNFDENFLPTLVPAPAPLRYSQDNHSAAQEQHNSQTDEINALLKDKSLYKNITTSKSKVINIPINLTKSLFSTSTEEGMGVTASTTTTRNLIKGMKASPAAHRAVRREKLDISRDMQGFTFQENFHHILYNMINLSNSSFGNGQIINPNLKIREKFWIADNFESLFEHTEVLKILYILTY